MMYSSVTMLCKNVHMYTTSTVKMNKHGREYMVGQGDRGHLVSSAILPWQGLLTFVEADSIVPWFTIQAAGYSHPGEL